MSSGRRVTCLPGVGGAQKCLPGPRDSSRLRAPGLWWGGGCSAVTTDPWACLLRISLRQGRSLLAGFLFFFFARKTRGSEVRRRRKKPRSRVLQSLCVRRANWDLASCGATEPRAGLRHVGPLKLHPGTSAMGSCVGRQRREGPITPGNPRKRAGELPN